MSNQTELDQLSQKLQEQTSLAENLEKELTELTFKASSGSNNDASSQLIASLTTENDKLKYRLNILEQSLKDVSPTSCVFASRNSNADLGIYLI